MCCREDDHCPIFKVLNPTNIYNTLICPVFKQFELIKISKQYDTFATRLHLHHPCELAQPPDWP